jgi:cathepsin D
MHYTSWLASATLFTTSVSAFYPCNGNSSPKEDNSANIGSLSDNGQEGKDGQLPTIDIKKRRTNVSLILVAHPVLKSDHLWQWDKRENKYPVFIASPPTLPNSMGINQDGSDYSYFSSIRIGSKGKDMWMLIDSGSANTWVFAADCTSQACSKHDTLGKADSDTLDITSNRWSVTYGTGDVGGVVASDKIAFAGYEVQLGFGLATNASDDFTTYPMDGILGLGRASSNKLGTPTLMDVMASQKLLPANLFGVHLSRSADGATDGQITFGAPDTSKFTGDLSYTDSLSVDGLWEIPADGAAVDGQSLELTGKTAIIDTGTSYILMPPKDAKALHAKIPGSSNSGEAFTVPCETKLPIQFSFSGVSYDVLPKDYVGKPDKTGKTCASNIVGHQSFGVDTWLLGDVFLKNVYTVFDFDKDRIGMDVTFFAMGALLTMSSGFGTKSAAASPTDSTPSSISPTSFPTPFETAPSDVTFSLSTAQTHESTVHTSSPGGNLPSIAGSARPMATATGKVTAVSSPSAAQATAMGSTEVGSGSPMEGKAIAWSASPLLAICISLLLAVSNA